MDIDNKVVARYLDGRVLKGVTRDFSPNRVSFHIEVHGTGEIVELRCRHLKALFFVRSLEGDSSRQTCGASSKVPPKRRRDARSRCAFATTSSSAGTRSRGRRIATDFSCSSDAGGNNHRIFVISASTDEIKAGPQAESLAQRVLAEIQARSPRAAVPGADSPAMGLTPASVQPRPSGTMPRPASGPAGTGPPAKAAGAGGVHEAGPSPRPSATLRRPADGKPRPPASDAA